MTTRLVAASTFISLIVCGKSIKRSTGKIKLTSCIFGPANVTKTISTLSMTIDAPSLEIFTTALSIRVLKTRLRKKMRS
jgi:hypothetical protein